MVLEGNETPNGWPLGLGNMNSRISVAEAVRPLPPRRLLTAATSFSSFSSSNLDTESTASFFPDQSVTLGRLIGIRPRNNKGKLFDEHRKMPDERSRRSGVPKCHEVSQEFCAPLLHYVMGKKGRNGNRSIHKD
ncbi:hypothetical protein CASFOL_040762 [Castilleja foliolosa]|uniref:Uncharacterized protein n=1 Tax=Castilleja foliolosa TaxID=1961234 RepID=A0ABD3BDD8_9LAMI